MLRASREEAQTDALTGLGNRRALARVLDRELPRATTADRPLVLVLFDLDGFKHYNDTFGHPAGDALLVRLGGEPAGLPAAGAAPRSGWAETSSARCSTSREPAGRAAHRRRCRRAVRARRGLRDRLLVRRDRAAHRGDRRRRRAADRRPAHVRAEERRPHVGEPAERRTCCCARWPSATPSCASTSPASPTSPRRPRGGCELGDDEVEQVRHAAELHDVGKVAIPDAILTKPGPLDDGRVGVHPPPHADRRADRRRRAGARPRGRARPLQPRALGRRRLPRRPGGRGRSRSAPASSRSPTRSTR